MDGAQHRPYSIIHLMDGAVLWPVACLSRRPQVMLLCEVNQALNQDASTQPAEGLTHCYWPVVGRNCGITVLENGCNR